MKHIAPLVSNDRRVELQERIIKLLEIQGTLTTMQIFKKLKASKYKALYRSLKLMERNNIVNISKCKTMRGGFVNQVTLKS